MRNKHAKVCLGISLDRCEATKSKENGNRRQDAWKTITNRFKYEFFFSFAGMLEKSSN